MQPLQLKTPEQLDRHSIVPWLQSVVEAFSGVGPEAFHAETVAPAGMPIELRFDDPGLVPRYCGRLTGWGTTAPAEATHFVVSRPQPGVMVLPEWTDPDFSPAEVDALLDTAGLKASFEDRNWRLFDRNARIGAQISFREGLLRPWSAGLLLIDWTLQSAGFSLTHAGTVGIDGRGVLLVGQSGAGKSGTTLAGLAEGLQSVGDDFVALRSDAAPVVRSVFPMGRQDPAGLDRIAGLRQRIDANRLNHLGKFEFDLRDTFPGAFVDELTVDAIVLPTLSDVVAPTMRPISATEAVVELLRSNPFRYVGAPGSRMARFGALARRRPCYRLELSSNAARNGRALRALLDTLASR